MGDSLARNEERLLEEETRAIQAWFDSDRFKYTKRPYSARDVAVLRGTVQGTPASAYTSSKLYNMLRSSFERGTYNHTFGALDPVQVIQMAKYLSCIYVSGWQCSSTASTTNEPGPDFADYPANTVPNKVDQLFRAQQFQDRRQREERSRMTHEERVANPPIDYMRPIIADGDTGFGGATSVMKLIKLHVEAGAAGVHIEDQKPGAKKCGHLAGKVLVPMREQVNRMNAARLQADILGVETVLISRTDAEAATLIESNIDPRDHPFIAGTSNKAIGACDAYCDAAVARGTLRFDAEQDWLAKAKICKFNTYVAEQMKVTGKFAQQQIDQWLKDSIKMSLPQMREHAASQFGLTDLYWDWEAPRTAEGYYRVIPGIDYSAQRAIAFAPVSDLIWMETKKPIVADADIFHRIVHAEVPHQMLAYNLSPSFNWSAAGMNDEQISQFQAELGKRGFTWHFITLAGFHTNALAIDNFAKAYAGPKGVLSYVQMIQREEERLGVETLTHQKWSGTELLDKMMSTSNPKISTVSSKGSTEAQFAKSKL